jgi:hypothetical protein
VPQKMTRAEGGKWPPDIYTGPPGRPILGPLMESDLEGGGARGYECDHEGGHENARGAAAGVKGKHGHRHGHISNSHGEENLDGAPAQQEGIQIKGLIEGGPAVACVGWWVFTPDGPSEAVARNLSSGRTKICSRLTDPRGAICP